MHVLNFYWQEIMTYQFQLKNLHFSQAVKRWDKKQRQRWNIARQKSTQNCMKTIILEKLGRVVHGENRDGLPHRRVTIVKKYFLNEYLIGLLLLLSPFYYKTGILGRFGSTKLVLPKWHKYSSLNRVIRVHKTFIGKS